jgi:hypothetical protein
VTLTYDPPKRDYKGEQQEIVQFYNPHASKSAIKELKAPEAKDNKEPVVEAEQSKESESNPSQTNEEYVGRHYEGRHYYPRQRYSRRGNRRGRNLRPYYDRSSYTPRYPTRGQVF